MKAILNILITLAALAGLGWTLQRGFTHRPEVEAEPHHEAAEEAKAEAEEAITVKVNKEQREALDLQLGPLAQAESKPQRLAFGHVLDPSPLLALDTELAAAESALRASKSEQERTQALLKGGQNVSQKTAETAEAQFRADEIKLRSAQRSAWLEWGAEFAGLSADARAAFVEALVKGEAAMVRCDVLPGDAISEVPAKAKLLVMGREDQPVETSFIAPAQDMDASTQAQGLMLRVERPAFALRPGMALTAYLELKGETRAGVTVPRSAILRHDGRTWVYVQGAEEAVFERRAVQLEVPQSEGWFVAEGLKTADKVVVQGAAILLSQELKAAGGLEEE